MLRIASGILIGLAISRGEGRDRDPARSMGNDTYLMGFCRGMYISGMEGEYFLIL